MDNFLIYEEINKRDSCVVYRGRIKRSIDFVMIYCVDKYKRHELSNLVRLMYELDHPHVMKFREWYETTNHLWLVMDLCDGGSLKSIIQADGSLPETSIRAIGVNICQGLYYLHQQEIIFCDLNPDKIVSDGSNTFKLANMTLSRMKGENLQSIFDETYDNYLDDVYRAKERPKAQAENFFYTAPEVLRGTEHSVSSDLWSLGCILYEMFAGRQLFDEKNTNKLTQKILNDRFVLPTSRGSTKPSIEFSSLLQGLLAKEPTKRLDWPAVLTHPFWSGQLTHLVRPQTNSTKKSVNQNETQDRPPISSRLATTDRPESNVSFSLSCTKTSIQISQPSKIDEIDGHKIQPNDHSSINTHEQSTVIGSENIERLRKMLFSKAELQPTPIVENQKIQKTLPFKFENKSLPFQLGKYENLSRLSSVDLQEHVNMIKKELSTTASGSPTNANGMRVKLNLLNYIGYTCLEQTNSGAFADALIAKEIPKDLLYLITNGASMELKMKATRLLGIIFNKATDNFPLSSSLTDTLVSLTEALRANSKETKFKLYLLQAIGEIMIFIAGRASDNSLVPGFTYQLIGRCLKDGDDFALNHAACKIIENLLLVADKQAEKLATTDVALALWNISSIHGNNEHLRASALAALCHMGLSYPDIVQSVIDKVTIKGDIFQSTSSKVLQCNITLLAILAKRTKNRTMFIQDILPKMNVLYENTNVLIRAKAYTLTYVLLSTYSESLYTLSDTKLFQAIERDVRRTSADPDENDLLHEALNRLITLLSSLLTRTLDELLSSTEQTRKASPAKDGFKKWLPSFRLISTIIGNHCIRSRVVTLMSIKKLFKLFSNIKLLTELHSELTKGPSSLTEIISYVSQTLDAFVRARDLLSLFSEILLTDLLPLCSQFLVSPINLDEFSLLALCILNELLTELKLTDCILPIHIQRDIKQEFHQTFLPIISDRHLLREEPIALLSLRFIQTIWTLIEHTPNSLTILSQSKLIPNLLTIISQNKDKPTGTFVHSVLCCLTTLAEKREMIQTMIEQGLVSIQLQLIQDQLAFSTTDRTMMNVLLELLSLLDRDLTYVLDIVKRALQVKKTGAGDADLPSMAEKLLQAHKPLVTLVGPMINLLSNEDPSIAKIALHNLSLLTQLIGSEGKAILTKNHCHILSSILRTTDTTKQKLLLRALKRLINGDKRSLDVARSNTNNELIQTLQQLKKSAATEADAGLISHIDDLLHLLIIILIDKSKAHVLNMPHVKLTELNQNLELYYEVHGSGKIKILFVMGLLTDGAAWALETEFFRQQSEYQCVSYDNRGCGRSSSPLTLKYTTEQMAKDGIALIDHLKWAQCHVVGVSMGGMIALEFALLAPERVLSLTLLATHAGGLAGRAPFVGIRHILRSFVMRDEHLQIENALEMLYGAKTLADPDKRKVFYNFHVQRFKKRVPPSLIGILGHIFAVQRHYVGYADLLKIRYSPFDCLIMVGTEDRLVREANSYMIRRTLGCRLVKLENAGHGLPGECAKEINEELFNWYESIRTNDSPKQEREVPKEYKTEIKALEQCCQHRTHCLVYDIVGVIKGLCLGLILYILLSTIGLTKGQLLGFHLTFESVILFGCLNGLRRAITCVYNAFHARRYVQEHRLLLNQAATHGGIGVALPGEQKTGIPHGCGFEIPIHSTMFIISLICLIYSISVYEQKVI